MESFKIYKKEDYRDLFPIGDVNQDLRNKLKRRNETIKTLVKSLKQGEFIILKEKDWKISNTNKIEITIKSIKTLLNIKTIQEAPVPYEWLDNTKVEYTTDIHIFCRGETIYITKQ